jgi:hypothetical protein
MTRLWLLAFTILTQVIDSNAQEGYSIIHFYRINSLREPKSTEFEVFFNDKQAFLLPIGGRIDFKMHSQGKLKVTAVLSATFRKTCNTSPIYFDVEHGKEYYVRVDGVSCISLLRSEYDGVRDLQKDYDFSFPVISKEENKSQPFMALAKAENDTKVTGPVATVNATSGLSSSGYKNKYALIIGNSAYPDAPLRNPANDARAIAAELKKLDFQVLSYTNLSKVAMKAAIRDFEERIRDNKGVAVFYYAGHGLQANGNNWLVPIDAKIEREYDIDDVCVKADMVLKMLEINENPMNIIILDACRNNPYAVSGRSLSRGLAQPENAPKGSIIAFATAPGKTASDGDGENGLYTQELIKALRKPGLSVEQIFKEVRVNVINISKNQQTPWENSSLLGDFYFRAN